MRVARQAFSVDLLSEIEELLFSQSALQIGARIHTGRDMALNIEAVAAMGFILGVPKMVETCAEQARKRCK